MRNFDLDAFLRQGAIVADSSGCQVFWGDTQRSSHQPEKIAVYAPDFFMENREPWYLFSDHRFFNVQKFRTELPNAAEDVFCTWDSPSRDDFADQFQQIKYWIERGELTKCVPFVSFAAALMRDRKSLILKVLRQALQQPTGYLYGLWNHDDFIIGLTPELLIEKGQDNSWRSAAVAGTTTLESFVRDPQGFLNNQKENREHDLVVDYITGKLQSFGTTRAEPKSTRTIGGLVHLVTPISLTASQDTVIEDLIAHLHPTPALGCLPKDDWRSRLRRMNSQERGRFGAPFGWADKNNCQLLVAIRNIQIFANRLNLLTGCGVVAESELQNEWLELQNKKDSVLRLLGL